MLRADCTASAQRRRGPHRGGGAGEALGVEGGLQGQKRRGEPSFHLLSTWRAQWALYPRALSSMYGLRGTFQDTPCGFSRNIGPHHTCTHICREPALTPGDTLSALTPIGLSHHPAQSTWRSNLHTSTFSRSGEKAISSNS